MALFYLFFIEKVVMTKHNKRAKNGRFKALAKRIRPKK
jgi:hypothetical protein